MATLARNECRQMLRYVYTKDEHLEKGLKLADAYARMTTEQDNLDRIKADFKAKLAAIEEEASQLQTQVQSGYELREYVCFWTHDDPQPGRKTLRRKEPPQDIVREEEMTIADRQTVMDAIDKAAKEQNTAAITLEAFDKIDVLKIVSVEGVVSDLQQHVEDACDIVLNADGTLKSESESRLTVLGLLQTSGLEYVDAFGKWLAANIASPECVIPGAAIALAAVEHELGAAKAKADGEKAREKKRKSEAKTERKANGSGTVDIPSDEGTRDDAGSESKDNL